jgi:hypothetical protein
MSSANLTSCCQSLLPTPLAVLAVSVSVSMFMISSPLDVWEMCPVR